MRSAMRSRAIGVSVKGEVGWMGVWRPGVDWVGNMENERERCVRFGRTAMVGAIGGRVGAVRMGQWGQV